MPVDTLTEDEQDVVLTCLDTVDAAAALYDEGAIPAIIKRNYAGTAYDQNGDRWRHRVTKQALELWPMRVVDEPERVVPWARVRAHASSLERGVIDELRDAVVENARLNQATPLFRPSPVGEGCGIYVPFGPLTEKQAAYLRELDAWQTLIGDPFDVALEASVRRLVTAVGRAYPLIPPFLRAWPVGDRERRRTRTP